MRTSRHRSTQAGDPARRSALPARRLISVVLILLLGLTAPACSIKKLAINELGDVLSEGAGTFASDDDPELIEAALPFTLKLMEALLAESPDHVGLRTAAAGGFAQYAYGFVHLEGDRLEERDLDAADASWERARKLYLRARDHALRGLEAEHEGLREALSEEPTVAVAGTDASDVPLLYWAAVSWAGAISLAKDDPDLIGDLPMVEAMIDRALDLDESFDHGAIHAFLIAYEMARSGGKGDPVARARVHYDRAVELSGGQLASPMVSLAESVAVAEQDRAGFEDLLRRALAVDPDERPEWRQSNLIHQRHARWLLGRADRLFLE